MKPSQKSLKDWTDQKWTTKSGKPSSKTGERYLPEAAIKSLSSAEYAATTKAKREGTKAGRENGYFATPMDAEIFEHELTHMVMLVNGLLEKHSL